MPAHVAGRVDGDPILGLTGVCREDDNRPRSSESEMDGRSCSLALPSGSLVAPVFAILDEAC